MSLAIVESKALPSLTRSDVNAIKELLEIWKPYLFGLTLDDAVVDRLIFDNVSDDKGVFVSPEGVVELFLGPRALKPLKTLLKGLLFRAIRGSK
jgi:hypothetical protein